VKAKNPDMGAKRKTEVQRQPIAKVGTGNLRKQNQSPPPAPQKYIARGSGTTKKTVAQKDSANK